MKIGFKMTSVAIACMLSSSLLAVENNEVEETVEIVESRGDWLRGSWGINWKPVDVYNGKSEQLTIDQLLAQISGLKTLDYIQLHLGESSIKSSVHIAPLEILESLWQGDTDAAGAPFNLIVPRASSGVDPFLEMVEQSRAAGLKIQVYINSSTMLRRVNDNEPDGYTPNPDYIPNITERWKALCDTDPTIQAFINSQPYHIDEDHPERQYMFAYAEFVLKAYSERYGELIDAWLFDTGEYMDHSGDHNTSGIIEEQTLYKAFADASRAGNPNAIVSFNNGPERDTEELNPFSEATHYDDYMFGHPYNGGRNLGRHDNGLYDRNYAHIEKMIETNGNAHAGIDPHDWEWDDKVIAHFDPPMSTTSWNGGNTAALTDEEFTLWNLEATRAGGAITWGVPLVKKSGLGDDLLIRDWGMSQLTQMDDHLAEFQEPGAPNWARAHTELTDAVFEQAYSHALVEGKDFWDPEGDEVTLTLVTEGAPTWLQLVKDEVNLGTWTLQGTPTELVETDYEFVIKAMDATGTTERVFNLYVGEFVEPEVPVEPEEPEGPLLAQVFASADTDYGVDQIATMVSAVQTAPDGLATFQIALDVTPMSGANVQSGSSSNSTLATSWGIGADSIFRGSDAESTDSITNLRIINFNANGSCLAAANLTDLSFNTVEIANGQSANDRVLVTSDGIINAEGGAKMEADPTQYNVIYSDSGMATEIALAVGNDNAKNKWAVNHIEVSYIAQEIVGVEGDFDCDGVLGSSDMLVIRAALGSSEGDDNFDAQADLDNDGSITRADYSLWYGLYRNQ